MAAILVVDDNYDLARPLTMLLRQMGHEGHAVASGEAALAFVRDRLPDLIILDAMMPQMDGMEVLRRLKDDPNTARVPVVMFSAIADREFQAHAISKGAQDFWVKASIGFDQIKDRVNGLLNKAN